jgi:hypothetical protein
MVEGWLLKRTGGKGTSRWGAATMSFGNVVRTTLARQLAASSPGAPL